MATKEYLLDWFNNGADAEAFRKAMRGGGLLLTADGNQDPPTYFRILSALQNCGEREEAVRTALAQRAAELLDRMPDVNATVFPIEREESLYTLICLSGWLKSPDILCERLIAMQQRGNVNQIVWGGISLKRMLDESVTENSQNDGPAGTSEHIPSMP